MADQSAPVAALTDGTGVSPINLTKLVKDFVADFLLTGAAALATANILDLGAAIDTPDIAALAVAGAAIRAGYRVVLRWATTD